jgi:hypothetical protein
MGEIIVDNSEQAIKYHQAVYHKSYQSRCDWINKYDVNKQKKGRQEWIRSNERHHWTALFCKHGI